MAIDLLQQFGNQAFTVGQQFAFQPQDQNKKMLLAVVKSIECILGFCFNKKIISKILIIYLIKAADLSAAIEGTSAKPVKIKSGQLLPNSSIIFEKTEGSSLNLTGKSKGYQ